jgi:hypothetical protein
MHTSLTRCLVWKILVPTIYSIRTFWQLCNDMRLEEAFLKKFQACSSEDSLFVGSVLLPMSLASFGKISHVPLLLPATVKYHCTLI